VIPVGGTPEESFEKLNEELRRVGAIPS
jgi:hypothetical protein